MNVGVLCKGCGLAFLYSRIKEHLSCLKVDNTLNHLGETKSAMPWGVPMVQVSVWWEKAKHRSQVTEACWITDQNFLQTVLPLPPSTLLLHRMW